MRFHIRYLVNFSVINFLALSLRIMKDVDDKPLCYFLHRPIIVHACLNTSDAQHSGPIICESRQALHNGRRITVDFLKSVYIRVEVLHA
jgi:hypothetical protein